MHDVKNSLTFVWIFETVNIISNSIFKTKLVSGTEDLVKGRLANP